MSPASGRSHAWDVATGARRRVTDHPVGVIDGTPTLDGERVIWFQDETGAESGLWLVEPFLGGEAARPFLEGVPHGWENGLTQAPGIVAAAMSDRDGFAVYVALGGEPRPRSTARPSRYESAVSTREGSSEEDCRATARCCASSTPSTAI